MKQSHSSTIRSLARRLAGVVGLVALAFLPATASAAPPACGDGTCNGAEQCFDPEAAVDPKDCQADCGTCPTALGNGQCEPGESCVDEPACGACVICGDGTCDATESCSTCAVDCGSCCGNGSCEAAQSEDCSSCAADCGACVGCGDGVCAGVEDCLSCAGDCGACAPVCGDGSCTVGETCASCDTDCGKCSTCGDGTCDASESCSSCDADCGACASASFGDCPADLPQCDLGNDLNDCCYKSFKPGSIIVPMDRCHQSFSLDLRFAAPKVADAFCADPEGGADNGMFEAYGLVYRAMQAGIPVYWMVNPTKDPVALSINEIPNKQTYTDRDVDFWVVSSGASAPKLGGALDPCIGACTPPVLHLNPANLNPIANSYTAQQFPTRGAAFVIDASDRARFDDLFTRSGEFAALAGDSKFDFTAVELYEVQNGAELIYHDFRDSGPAYPEFNGGDSAPIFATLDYEPPRLARQTPANVSALWLGLAKLEDPAKYPDCLTGAFEPATAVYCDMSTDEMKAGYLTSGDFDWAWVDNDNGGTCDDVFMDEVTQFLTAVPGVKDGHSVFFMESAVNGAEACDDKELQGATGGLDVTGVPPAEPYVIRHPTNIFSQFGDVPPGFSAGATAKWDYSTVGYQKLESLRRLVTEDTGTTCSFHRSTAACDEYSGTTGDMSDVASYARYKDGAANGVSFYMGGRNVNQTVNAAQLRMVLNSFLALPAGQVDSTPDSSVLVEVSRSAPVVATVFGEPYQFQGTISVIDPAEQVTTFTGAADATTFRFPHFAGHMRAINTSALNSSGVTFDSLNCNVGSSECLFDATDHIPAMNLSGCIGGAGEYSTTCRNVFTSLETGALPARLEFTSANLAVEVPALSGNTLASKLGKTLTTADAEILMGLVMAGRDDDSDGTYESALGGVDRSTVAIIEASPLTGYARPTMLYFGGLDGMLHAVCAEDFGGICSAGQELWAFIPRTQLPLLAQNTQRIDGSAKVAEVFGDPDGAGTQFALGFHTILTFQTGSGEASNDDAVPAVIALEVSDPQKPVILWEVATPIAANRGPFEMGVGLGLAMGPVKTGTGTKHLTFVQTTNGGTGGTGFVVQAIETLTGTVLWTFQQSYPDPLVSYADFADGRLLPTPIPMPTSGLPGGVGAYSATKGSTLTHIVAPSLYGDLWLINAATGLNDHQSLPLFRFTTHHHPIGAPATVFMNPEDGEPWTLVVSGGYVDPVAVDWAPDGTEQFAVAMPLLDAGDPFSQPFTEDSATGSRVFSLGTASRGFAQAVVAGSEVFIVTDTTDVNSGGYGLGSSATGSLSRLSLSGTGPTFGQIGGTISVPGGASSVDVTSTGVSFSGAGKAAQSSDFSGDFSGPGSSSEIGFNDNVTRLLWLSE